jgi:retron-type reverse transcriptase
MTTKTRPPIFQKTSSIDDVAALLDASGKQLRYLLYARQEMGRYTMFTISKRRGGKRTIKAPKEELKAIQRRLGDFLQDKVEFRQPAHGFVRERSIATNAALHVHHRAVFNLDLKDFFPTINFGRVRGLFMADPFKASPAVATILAQICCHEGSLPQGAPTSPVISNMICSRLDAQLQRLAKNLGCVYTRYADDLTFSKRKGAFPKELAIEDVFDEIAVGKKLRAIIEQNGFQIHPDKVHLYRNTHRQTVTGLTVNSRVNVPRKYIREIRAIICDWRKRGRQLAEETHHKHFYRRPSKLGGRPPLHRILEGKLNFIKMVRGVDDGVRRNLQRQFVNVWPEYQTIMEKENNELNMRDLFISHASEDKKDFVRPLVEALIREGVSVWYDEYEIMIGDTLVSKINDGLVKSRYGVVVLSPNFFNVKKTWPNHEVGALFAQEDADNRPRVLPIWHDVDQKAVAAKNPILAGKAAWLSRNFTPAELAIKFRDFMKSRR